MLEIGRRYRPLPSRLRMSTAPVATTPRLNAVPRMGRPIGPSIFFQIAIKIVRLLPQQTEIFSRYKVKGHEVPLLDSVSTVALQYRMLTFDL